MLQLGEVVEALLLSDGRLPKKDTDAKMLTAMLYCIMNKKSYRIHVFALNVDLNSKLRLTQ